MLSNLSDHFGTLDFRNVVQFSRAMIIAPVTQLPFIIIPVALGKAGKLKRASIFYMM